MPVKVFTTTNSMNDVGDLVARADEIFTSRLDPRMVYKANLVLEEILTNIVKYAYDDTDVHSITVRVETRERNVLLIVEDDGIPFNPLEQADPPQRDRIEQLPVGGLGIHLVKHTATTLMYTRKHGKNILTIGLEP